MDFKVVIVVCLIFFIHSSFLHTTDEREFFKHISSEDYYDSDEEVDTEDKFRLNDKHLKFDIAHTKDKQADEEPTEGPEAKYEVTEIIDDIPNNTTVVGPIITNFTVAIPLNNVTVPNFTITSNSSNENNNNDKIGTPSFKRNYISIFHIKAEYDNDKPEITVIQNNRPNFPWINGFQDYIKGVRQGILNGLQNFINNNNNNNNIEPVSDNNVNGNAPDVHNIVNAPVVFWNKLHSKTSDVSKRVHSAIFGRKFDNSDDDFN